MKIVETTFERLLRERLEIGFEGENQRATVRIDCSSVFAEYPNATPTLIVKPLFADAYPVVVDRNGTDVDWLITSEILSFTGDGEIQLVFYKDQVICKSAVSKIRVSRSLTVTGEMPDPVVQWIENANRKLAEVDAQIVELEGMVDTATDAATRAEQSASTASAKAEQAATSAATATAQATEATNAAGTATAKAAEAALSATQARNSAVSAADSERIATAKAGDATTAAGTATTKAEQATGAAQTATEKARDASASATAAQASATDAASSATAASASETAAKASKTAASTSATQAAQSAQTANTAAQTSEQKAGEAATSATNAAASATNAATSAETASTKAGEAAQSAQAVEETAEQLAESLEQISQNTADIAEHEQEYNALKEATLIHNTASGAIASFSDSAEMPVDEVTAQINPVQDLHGYDSPWPAGGGENKINLGNSYTFTTTKDQPIDTIPQGTAWVYRDSFSYTTTPASGAKNPYVVFYDENNNAVGGIWVNPNGKTSSVSLTGNAVKVRIYSNGYNYSDSNGVEVTITGLVISTTEVSAYTPYSNICPISGFDGLTVTRTGKNLLNPKLYSGGYYNPTIGNTWDLTESSAQLTDIGNGQFSITLGSWAFRVFVFDLADGQSYRFRCVFAGTDIATSYGYLDGDYTVLSKYNETGATVNKSVMFTGSSKNRKAYVGFAPRSSNQTLTLTELQLELGSTATAYEPYVAQSISISFPSDAGTVYGGSLTIAEDGSGVLTVDRAMVDLGTLGWQKWSGSQKGFYASVPGASGRNALEVCSQYKRSAYSSVVNGSEEGIFAMAQTTKMIYLYDSQYQSSDAATFKSAMSGVQLVYELATPITYTLTASQITTLLGENNLWHDANGDISVGYKANTKLYIDNKIAELVARIVNS